MAEKKATSSNSAKVGKLMAGEKSFKGIKPSERFLFLSNLPAKINQTMRGGDFIV